MFADGSNEALIAVPAPPFCTMKVVEVEGRSVSSRHSNVVVLQMRDDGLDMVSHLVLPQQIDIVLSFRFEWKGSAVELLGSIENIVIRDNLYEYAIRYKLDESSRLKLSEPFKPCHPAADEARMRAIQSYHAFWNDKCHKEHSFDHWA